MLQILANLCNTSVGEIELFFESAIKWFINAAFWCAITAVILLIIAGIMLLILTIDNNSTVRVRKRTSEGMYSIK